MEKVRRLKVIKSLLLNFFIGGGIITLITFKNLPNEPLLIFQLFCLQGLLWTALAHVNGAINGWLGKKFPWSENPVKTIIVLVFASLTATVLTAVSITTIWAMIFWDRSFKEALQFSDFGFLSVVIVITVFVSLVLYGRNFFLAWREMAVEAERLKRENLASKYEALKTQINPHFLFNSLNVLSSLVYKDPDLSAKFIQQLATVYRHVLDTQEQELVSLKTELQGLEAFVFLLQIRFGENFKVAIDVPEPNGAMIPPLSLQLLIENSVKHNIISKNNPLKVEVFMEGKDQIVVRNNLQEKRQLQESSGIGLENIRSRYRILANKTIDISDENNFFTVKLPLLWLEA
ncbi:MAG: histidine kinase [Saprospiraceae bacterium]|nr:histidine kinase [Saprospiraceae bacterium]